MKKAISITLAVLAFCAWPASAGAGEKPTAVVVIAAGPEANEIQIWLTADGRTYVIDSVVPLEVGGTVCENPPGIQNELNCQATQVADFIVNAEAGDDQISVAPSVSIPVTLRGGTGNDVLVGGSGPDSLNGGAGGDKLVGRSGNDVLLGGEGRDSLFGGSGDDVLKGGPGHDLIAGGPGDNRAHQSALG
jgi:hypothetical protein